MTHPMAFRRARSERMPLTAVACAAAAASAADSGAAARVAAAKRTARSSPEQFR